MYSLASPLPKSPPPFFIIEFEFFNAFSLGIYFGFLYESPLDRPIRSSINVDRPIKVYHMAATCPLLQASKMA